MIWILVAVWLNGVSVTEFSKENHCVAARDAIRNQKIVNIVKADCISAAK